MFQLTGADSAGRDGCDGLVLKLPTLSESLGAVLQRTVDILMGIQNRKKVIRGTLGRELWTDNTQIIYFVALP